MKLFQLNNVGEKEKLSSVDAFVQKAEVQIKEASETISNRSIAIEAAFDRLFEVVQPTISSENISRYREACSELLVLYENKFVISLENIIFNALRNLKDRIASKVGNAFVFLHKPLFRVEVLFKYPDVVLVPGLDKIQSAINRVAKNCVFVSKRIRKWEISTLTVGTDDCQRNLDDCGVECSYFENFGSNLSTVKLLLQLAGALIGLKDHVSKHIDSFTQYKLFWNINESVYVQNVLDTEVKTSMLDKLVPKTDTANFLIFSNNHQVKRFETEFASLNSIRAKIFDIRSTVVLESLAIDSSSLKSSLQRNVQRWEKALAMSLHSWSCERLLKLNSFLNEAEDDLSEEINSLEELQKVMSTLSRLRELESTIDTHVTNN